MSQPVTDRAGHVGSFRPVRRQTVDRPAVHTHIVWRVDLQQGTTDRQILEVDLEVDQDLEERSGWTPGAIDDAPAARRPGSNNTASYLPICR